MFRLASVQSTIVADVEENGRHVRAAVRRAAQAGARLVHFPEAALSGYITEQIADWGEVDWPALKRELDAVAAVAAELGVWVVLGANHPRQAPLWPFNSVYIISDTGILAGRYDKRLCSNTETTYWYSLGMQPLVFDVDGIRFGCALCIEAVFPHVFAEYERLGVHCMLLSAYSPDPMHGVMAQAHAATTCMWVSLATPVACSPGLPTTLFGPDGHTVATCAAGAPGLLVQPVNLDADRYRVALRVARPWRARIRSGGADPGRTTRLA